MGICIFIQHSRCFRGQWSQGHSQEAPWKPLCRWAQASDNSNLSLFSTPATSAVQFTLIHGPNIPGFYAVLFFTASDFTFTTRYIHNWMSFLVWLSLFIPSGAISTLFSSSILGTYGSGEFLFQCHISLPFYCSWDSQGRNAKVVYFMICSSKNSYSFKGEYNL